MVLLHYIELTLFFQKIKRYFIKKLTVSKKLLASQRGVTTEKINNAQTATYTLTLNDGNKKVVNLKKNDDAKNSIDRSTIKQIQIVVK